MSVCPNCNQSSPDGAKFCQFCGNPMPIAQTPPEPEAADAQQVPPAASIPPEPGAYYGMPNNSDNQYSYGGPTGHQQYNTPPQYDAPQYDAPQYDNAPQYPRYVANIQKRDIVTSILLSIVTCGIYGLYWYWCIINDLNTASQETDDFSAAGVILLSIVTCGIYGWVWLYKAGKKVDKINQLNGQPSSDSSLIYIILAIFQLSIVDYCLIQSELNKVAAN